MLVVVVRLAVYIAQNDKSGKVARGKVWKDSVCFTHIFWVITVMTAVTGLGAVCDVVPKREKGDNVVLL